MKILALDSSSKSASVSLFEDHKLLGESFINAGLTHSQTLMQMVLDVTKVAHTKPDEIDYFALTKGPGSFTGLRIAASAVKGMASATKKPCVTVSTLSALSYNLIGFEGYALALLDARCNQFYYGLFRLHKKTVEKIVDDRAGDSTEIMMHLESIKKTIYLLGDGAELFKETNEDLLRGKSIILPNDRIRFVNGYAVALAALSEIEKGNVMSAKNVAIEYLRMPQAERELRAKKGLL